MSAHLDPFANIIVYDLPDGRRINFDANAFRELGLAKMLELAGLEPPTGRVQVWQRGRQIGTVPAAFHPLAIKSTSPFYEPRPDDFRFEDGRWVVDRMLGPGDLEAVPGFRWESNGT